MPEIDGKKKPWYVRQLELAFQTVFTTGVALAVVQSWEKFQSVKFSMLAGFASWFYVAFPGAYDHLMK